MSAVVGLLLAAGAGRRAGGPKALRVDPDGTSWLVRAVRVLLDGGCDRVLVVLGCESGSACRLLTETDRVSVVECPDWSGGLSASLRTGLDHPTVRAGDAVVVHLVDLPDVEAAVVTRLLTSGSVGRTSLSRSTYAGRPGHPVLVGADHLDPLIATLGGDAGARAYLDAHRVVEVECGDLATGRDRDHADA